MYLKLRKNIGWVDLYPKHCLIRTVANFSWQVQKRPTKSCGHQYSILNYYLTTATLQKRIAE